MTDLDRPLSSLGGFGTVSCHIYFSQLAHSFRCNILELNQNKYKTRRYDKVLNKKKKKNQIKSLEVLERETLLVAPVLWVKARKQCHFSWPDS